jgi:hypothetical protein
MPQARADLAEIIEAIDFAGDESTAFWDRQTSQVVVITDADIAAAEDEALAAQAPDWQREAIAMARLIDADAGTRFVPLPTRFDAHEWQMMAAFAARLPRGRGGRPPIEPRPPRRRRLPTLQRSGPRAGHRGSMVCVP